jgi:hypothetical protein
MLKRIFAISFLIITMISAAKAQSAFSWPTITEVNKPWTRWWWSGNAVDTQGIKYNLQQFHQAGIGGVEITPIYGVKGFENKFIDYLSPKWMRMLHYTINEAHQLNMGADMVTGTGWPFGGPQIPIQDAASKIIFQAYALKGGERLQQPVEVDDSRQKNVAVLQTLMAYSDKGQKINLTNKVKDNILNWTAPDGNWKLIAAFDGKTLQKVKRAAPGGEGWVMDPFSEQALQKYLRRFTTAFSESKVPPPHNFFCDSYEVFGADWTMNLFQDFSRDRGYSLQDYLPALMKQGNEDTITRVIADYRETLSDELLHHFVIPWTQWAHQMGSVTRYQAHGSPGNLLDLYGAADIPEIESFGSAHFNIPGLTEDSLYPENKRATLDPLLLKFSSSAAHVMGRKLASSETFTWLGEHFRVSLAECKPVLDQMLVSGINHVYFQGSPYSPKGAPWPGWQFYASINVTPYNTFWQDIHAFDTYIGRVQSFLQKGQPDNDVLLYWPVQDVWAMKTRSILLQLAIDNASEWLDPTYFHQVAQQLMKGGFGFDYISDLQIQKADVENGSLQTHGVAYRALVIPPCRFMPEKTLKQILALAKAGAKIIFLDHFPKDVPGLHDLEERRTIFYQQERSVSPESSFTDNTQRIYGKGKFFTGTSIDKLMRMADIKPEGFNAAGLQYIRRETDDGYIYFVANLDSARVNQWIPLAENISSAVMYDACSGEIGKGSIRTKRGQTEIYLQLQPGQSLIIKGSVHKDVAGPSWHYLESAGNPVPLNGKWKLTFEEGPEGLTEKMPRNYKSYTLDHLVSWTTLNDSARIFTGTAKYFLTFDLPKEHAHDWLLSLGEVDCSADLKINGKNAGTLWSVPFDVHIGKFLKPGKNTLELDVTNLGANRIAEYDRKGVDWKKFYDINVANMQYKPFDAASWQPVPSGLLGPVTLTPLRAVIP